MVCHRCILAVEKELEKLSIPYEEVKLGQVKFKDDPATEVFGRFKANIEKLGFEILDDERQMLIEKIKTELIDLISFEQVPDFKLSEYLSRKLHRDYSILSNLFSSVEGQSIETFFIKLRIEKVKEHLVYGELSLSEIAYKLGFSSVSHLSSQFKKWTGFSPTKFKSMGFNDRKNLDNL